MRGSSAAKLTNDIVFSQSCLKKISFSRYDCLRLQVEIVAFSAVLWSEDRTRISTVVRLHFTWTQKRDAFWRTAFCDRISAVNRRETFSSLVLISPGPCLAELWSENHVVSVIGAVVYVHPWNAGSSGWVLHFVLVRFRGSIVKDILHWTRWHPSGCVCTGRQLKHHRVYINHSRTSWSWDARRFCSVRTLPSLALLLFNKYVKRFFL